MSTIKDRNGMDLAEAEEIKKWQEYRGGLPFPSPGDLPDQGMEPVSLLSPALEVDFLLTEPP